MMGDLKNNVSGDENLHADLRRLGGPKVMNFHFCVNNYMVRPGPISDSPLTFDIAVGSRANGVSERHYKRQAMNLTFSLLSL